MKDSILVLWQSTMSDTVLYFWCFRLERDDEAPFLKRHILGKTIYYGLCTLGVLILISGAFFGLCPILGLILERIALIKGCDSITIFWSPSTPFGCLLNHVMYGITAGLFYFLNVAQTAGVLSPLLVLIWRLEIFKVKIATVAVVGLLSVYATNVMGVAANKIFRLFEGCTFDSYESFIQMQCFGLGSIACWTLIGVYTVAVLIYGGVIYVKECVDNTRRIQDEEAGRPLITEV
jgi:hypothetical protein